MPRINILRTHKITDSRVCHIGTNLPEAAAAALSCKSLALKPEDIMIVITDVGPFDVNVKDVNVDVLAHAYPDRVENADMIRRTIARALVQMLPDGVSWYVWLRLGMTSYGSDTMD